MSDIKKHTKEDVHKKIFYKNHFFMYPAFCLNLIGEISSGKVTITEISEEERLFLLKFLLISLGIDNSVSIEKFFTDEKENTEIKLQKDLLFFENQLASLPEIDSCEIVIKSMENKLLDNNLFDLFKEKICHYFDNDKYSDGIVIFLSNIFEPTIRKKIYMFFWKIMINNNTFKFQHGKNILKIIQSITFNEKELIEFESLFATI